jgi:hypothetical protein
MQVSHTVIEKCRICGNPNLVSVLHLGDQVLTGVFPRSKEQTFTSGPLELVKCHPVDGEAVCHLVQLRCSFPSTEMYGMNYGYRSGLNQSMVDHLRAKVEKIRQVVSLQPGDLILDIGSNDSTLLQSYPADQGLKLLGIDPAGVKFSHFYPAHIGLLPEFFSAQAVIDRVGMQKAKVITSIAMFYDLENPLHFVQQIADVLADDGIWVFEQSYMPTMLEVNAYDTICHEHLEYYGLKQVKWLLDRVGMQILDVTLNQVNGGSFSVTAAKQGSRLQPNIPAVDAILAREEALALDTLQPYALFRERVFNHAKDLTVLIRQLRADGQLVLGYGASTKGNVILQFCGLSVDDIPYFAEVNPDKFGSYTPGTLIPIISEVDARAMKPDYFLVMPWHFRDNLVGREQDYLQQGGKLIFPLPIIEIVSI